MEIQIFHHAKIIIFKKQILQKKPKSFMISFITLQQLISSFINTSQNITFQKSSYNNRSTT
jgi:hypothetical protein